MPTWPAAHAGAGLSEWFGVAELRAVPGQVEQASRTTESAPHEAGRQSCRRPGGGFAALADHADARHVRRIAPAEWRIDRVAAERVVTRTEARRLVAADDRKKRVSTYGTTPGGGRPVKLPPNHHRQHEETG